MLAVTALMFGYETGCAPSCTATPAALTRLPVGERRHHRLHHYKNEHYWFTVTTAGTADRLLGTYPDAATVETSPTVRRLHAQEETG